jgi:hypothetical protein
MKPGLLVGYLLLFLGVAACTALFMLSFYLALLEYITQLTHL